MMCGLLAMVHASPLQDVPTIPAEMAIMAAEHRQGTNTRASTMPPRMAIPDSP